MNSPMMMIKQNDLIETIIEPLEHEQVEWRDNDKEVYMNWTWEQMTLTSAVKLDITPTQLVSDNRNQTGNCAFP